MVLGGRLGDLLGLRRVFLIGAVVFAVSTAFAGFAQDMAWMIAARAAQGLGAALMMPTAVAIVSSVFPGATRHGARNPRRRAPPSSPRSGRSSAAC